MTFISPKFSPATVLHYTVYIYVVSSMCIGVLEDMYICTCTAFACYNDRYQREFGFTIPSRDIRVDDIRVRAMGRACSHNPTPITTPTSDIPVPTKVSYEFVM